MRPHAYPAMICALLLAASCSYSPTSRPGLPSAPQGDYSGFHVAGIELRDGNGAAFRIQGPNVNHWWNTGSDNRESVPCIKATGANAARLVFGPVEDPANPDWYVCKTTAERRAVVEEYVKYRIVPIVEYHNATGSNDPAKVMEAADFWIGESWVRDLERYVIVNITNEWCASNAADEDGRLGSDEIWRDAYLAAVARMRAAGIRNAILIDSINWASEISAVQKYGKTILDADPLHNVLFSLHMYGGWRGAGADPDGDDYFYMTADVGIQTLNDLGLAVVVGEFSHDCSIDMDPNAAEDEELLDAFDAQGTGWLCWMWYNTSGHYQNMVFQSDNLLYTAFGRTINDYLANAAEATVFPSTPVPPLPVAPVPNPNWRPEGPLTVIVSNDWWMDARLPDMDGIAYMQMETASGDIVSLSMTGWGPFAANQDLAPYLNTQVRFLIGAGDGSTAQTVYGNLYFVDNGDVEEVSSFAIAP